MEVPAVTERAALTEVQELRPSWQRLVPMLPLRLLSRLSGSRLDLEEDLIVRVRTLYYGCTDCREKFIYLVVGAAVRVMSRGPVHRLPILIRWHTGRRQWCSRVITMPHDELRSIWCHAILVDRERC